ncbi:hypothetical protein ACB098_10G087600 [Castanea mollissima]
MLSKNVSISRALLAQSFYRLLSTQTGSKLKGKVALITGGASGIGNATAAKFINKGAKVVIANIQHQLGQHTAKELGTNATFVACDVTKESDISNAVDFTVSKYNQLDIMYNNAGVPCKTPPSIVDLDFQFLINHGHQCAGSHGWDQACITCDDPTSNWINSLHS